MLIMWLLMVENTVALVMWSSGMLNQQFRPPEIPPDPPAPPVNNLQDEEDDDGGAVDGDIDSEVILAQKPSESI